jgi:hypothetical protein
MDCLKCHKFRQEEIDEITSDELKIFFDNEESFYRQRYIPFLKNYARKMKRGIYDHNMAVGGIQRNLVNDIIKAYDGIELRDVNKSTRKHLAENITESIEDEIRIDHHSNYDEVLKR